MRNRWYHIPQFHLPSEHAEKKVTWLELFYDLIFVASFIQLGNGLGHNVSVGAYLGFCAVFVPLWMAWTGFTYFSNRYTINDFTHRLIVFGQMFSVGAMAVTAPDVLKNNPQKFALAYAFAQTMVALLYWRAHRTQKIGRGYSRYWGSVFGFGALLWTVAAFVPPPLCYGLWAVGMGMLLASPFSKQSRLLAQRYPQDNEHLSERYGLLTLIVLGESFVKVLAGLDDGNFGWSAIGQASLALLITCCLWWIYFDDVAGSKLKKEHLAPMIWLYAHIPLQIGLIAVGVGIKKAVVFDLAGTAPEKYRWLLCASLALALLSVSIIDSVTERRDAELSDHARVQVRFFSAILILLMAVVGGAMSAAWFLFLVLLICIAQVIFDMMMAPLEAHEGQDGANLIADIARQGAAGRPVRRKRRDIGEAVRKGTPNTHRKDVYFFFMEGSWRRVSFVILALYLVVNLFFAALFLLQPGSIAQARPNSFADAFSFSVQTMSTIGYGTLAPATAYGNTIVAFEAAVGLLGVALVTGLMFAKASRPRASVLFSKHMVVTRRHGVPTLMFRVGNARGNDLIDANIHLTALFDEISPEGHHMRRIHDLSLARNHTPFFSLTWQVMHFLDENSPLRDQEWSADNPHLIALMVTLTGHDGTYGQTVYARHSYYPENVRVGHRFVDVTSELPDGRLMVDYHGFHDTIPDTPPDS